MTRQRAAWGLGFLLVLAATGARPVAAEAEWTWLFYTCADNDLETPQLENIRQMMQTGSDADVNLVVLLDRSPKGEQDGPGQYSNDDLANIKNWSGVKLLKVEKGLGGIQNEACICALSGRGRRLSHWSG